MFNAKEIMELQNLAGMENFSKLTVKQALDREKLIELLNEASEKLLEAVGGLNDNHGNGMRADHLIAHGVTVQEWISVKDRLPEPFENVLVFRDGKISIDYYEENGWFAYDFKGKRATHWQPIPKPPKGE